MLKCTKFDFGWGSAPDPGPRWGAYSAPLAGFKGPTSKGEGRKGRGKEGRGKREGGEEGNGEGRQLSGPNADFWLRHCQI